MRFARKYISPKDICPEDFCPEDICPKIEISKIKFPPTITSEKAIDPKKLIQNFETFTNHRRMECSIEKKSMENDRQF
jgi:hypothetical protein